MVRAKEHLISKLSLKRLVKNFMPKPCINCGSQKEMSEVLYATLCMQVLMCVCNGVCVCVCVRVCVNYHYACVHGPVLCVYCNMKRQQCVCVSSQW